jgi:hypothetical protein
LESQDKTQDIIKQAKWNFPTSHKSEAEIRAFQQQDQSLIEGQISLLIFLFDEHHHQNK